MVKLFEVNDPFIRVGTLVSMCIIDIFTKKQCFVVLVCDFRMQKKKHNEKDFSKEVNKWLHSLMFNMQ